MTSDNTATPYAQAAPYLTHAVTHHGRITLVPPDNAGRMRKAKENKKTRAERREEEIRFNLGYPKNVRLRTSSPARAQRRQDRPDIPNYPPPSFLEAIAAPPVTVIHQSPQALVTILPVVHDSPQSRPTSQEEVHLRSPISHASSSSSVDPAPTSLSRTSNADHSSDSDVSSIEIVDVNPSEMWELDRQVGIPVNERAQRQFSRHKQSTGQPDSPSTSTPTSRSHLFKHPTSRHEIREHPGQISQISLLTPTDGRLNDVEGTSASSITPTRWSPKKPFSSGRPFADRSPTVHSSPSKLSLLRSHTFMKSTPTLHGQPSLSPLQAVKNVKSDNVITRKLFHSKFKEEPLESWEVVDSAGRSEENQAHGRFSENSGNSASRPISPVDSSYSLDASSFSTQPDENRDGRLSPQIRVATEGQQSPTSSMFLSRHIRHPHSDIFHSSPPSSVPVSPTSTPPSLPSANAVSTPIRRTPPVLAWKDQIDHRMTSPLCHPHILRSEATDSTEGSAAVTLFTPQDEAAGRGVSPTAATALIPAPSVPTIVRPRINVPGGNAEPSSDRGVVGRNRIPRELDGRDVPTYSTVVASDVVPPYTRNRSPELTVQGGRHYPGRPLPHPPAIYPSLPASPVTSVHNQPCGVSKARLDRAPDDSPCPEGLLIDLSDDSEDTFPDRSTSSGLVVSPQLISQQVDDSLRAPTLSNPITPIALHPTNSSDALTLRTLSSSPQNRPLYLEESLEQTDLDLLIDRVVDQDEHDGANYDALLRLAEFIGPATPIYDHHTSAPTDLPSSCLIGKVELQRRRVTQDGRVKLKLSLLGMSVDKCAICLSQFRENDMGTLGVKCQHAFHAKCLKTWLVQSRTCPLCREFLDNDT